MDTGNCTAATLHEQIGCSKDDIKTFSNTMREQIWLGNALLFASTGIIGVLVGISGYGQRYRHHPFTRFIFLGANTLFLPIVSSVVSTLSDSSNDYVAPDNKSTRSTLAALCYSNIHPCTVITWAFLVQIASINTTSVVATDTRESQRIGPSLELLVKAIWIFYLGASITRNRFFYAIFHISSVPISICSKIMFAPFVLICAKFWLKGYAFTKARLSFALGRNPGLVFGYMQQLQQQERSQHGEPLVGEDAPPPLLVMGEDTRQVVNHPHGYVFTNGSGVNNGLVTLDKIWQSDNELLTLPKLKDLCLSYALFKLLRCRFARYKISDVDYVRMLAFFRGLLLMEGGHDRVFRVIADELSFVHDYYHSSSSISYAKCWLPILNTFISLLSIVYCIVAASSILGLVVKAQRQGGGQLAQIQCKYWRTKLLAASKRRPENFGSLYFDLVAVFLLLAFVLSTELRDIASYICSNWTKVSLIYHHVNCASSQHLHGTRNWLVSRLLKCRSMRVNHWEETMGQCSVLALDHPRPNPFVRLIHFFRLPDQMKKVKVPEAVKVRFFDALRSISGNNHGLHLNNRTTSLHPIRVGDRFIWACNGKGIADVILTWHIATCILEMRHPYQHDLVQDSSLVARQHKIVATHVSRYCAYLMTWFPEILPDEVEWSKSLYDAVHQEATRVISVRAATSVLLAPEANYLELVQLLSEGSKHEVLKNGVRLAKQMVEELTEAEAAWEMLADFWVEMILYIAPSNNLRGHAKAIARGGELITLLWALLFHAGIVSRPGETGRATIAASV